MTRVTTTCPQCATIFRVNPEQLAARRGQVRCGRCRHVFNGYETVSVGPDLPENEVASTPAAGKRGAWWPRWLGGSGPDRDRPPAGNPGVGAAAPAVRAEGLTKMVDLVRGGPDPTNLEPGALRVRPAFGIEIEQAPDDFSLDALRMRRRLLRVGIGVIAIGLLVALVAGRRQIVQTVPALRPIYTAACQALQCQIPLPADADAWSVESNELLEDPNVPQLFHFAATLRNRSRYAQAYPTLDLSLTDMEGLAVDRRVVPPQQYLPGGHPVTDGLAPNAEVAVRVEVKGADRRSQGYRVVLFFP